MSRRKGKPEGQTIEPEGLRIEIGITPPKVEAEPKFILERAPKPEPGQVRKAMHFSLWELDAEHRSKGRAMGARH